MGHLVQGEVRWVAGMLDVFVPVGCIVILVLVYTLLFYVFWGRVHGDMGIVFVGSCSIF